MPRRALLVGMGNSQEGFLSKRLAKHLKSDRQLRLTRESTRQTQPAIARQIAGDCENIAQVHLQRIPRFLPHLDVVDISTDPELTREYGTSIPVGAFDEEVRFRGRVSEVLLRRLIRMTEPE